MIRIQTPLKPSKTASMMNVALLGFIVFLIYVSYIAVVFKLVILFVLLVCTGLQLKLLLNQRSAFKKQSHNSVGSDGASTYECIDGKQWSLVLDGTTKQTDIIFLDMLTVRKFYTCVYINFTTNTEIAKNHTQLWVFKDQVDQQTWRKLLVLTTLYSQNNKSL